MYKTYSKGNHLAVLELLINVSRRSNPNPRRKCKGLRREVKISWTIMPEQGIGNKSGPS